MTVKAKNVDLVTSVAGSLPIVFLAIAFLTGKETSPDLQAVVTDIVLAIVSWYVGK